MATANDVMRDLEKLGDSIRDQKRFLFSARRIMEMIAQQETTMETLRRLAGNWLFNYDQLASESEPSKDVKDGDNQR